MVRKFYLIVFVNLLFLAIATLSFAKTIKIDGDFSDWGGVTTSWTDKKGDALNSKPGDDLVKFWVTMNEGTIFFRIDLAGESYDHAEYTPAIYIDSDNNPETGGCYGADFLVWFNPSGSCYAAKWTGKKGGNFSVNGGGFEYTALSVSPGTNSVGEDPNKWTSLEVGMPVSSVGITSLNQKVNFRVITLYGQDFLPPLYLPPITYEADFGTKENEKNDEKK